MEDLAGQKPIESFFNPEAMMYLHYDAQIMLTFSRENNAYVLHSQGFNDPLVEFQHQETFKEDPNECVFRVVPLVSYKVWQNAEALVSSIHSRFSIKDKQNLESQLTKLDRENKTRFLELQKLRGKFISFNTPIQLQHVVSHKYLAVARYSGIQDTVFMLNDHPSEMTVLKLLPSFKFQTENQKYVRFDQEVYISMVFKEESYFMNFRIDNNTVMTEQEEESPKVVRGNIKLKSKLELQLNLPSIDSETKESFLFYGDIIWLIHAEHLAQIDFSHPKGGIEQEVSYKMSKKLAQKLESSEQKPLSGSLEEKREDSGEQKKSLKLNKGFQKSLAGAKINTALDIANEIRSLNLQYLPLTSTNQENTNSMWKIESIDKFQGGIINFSSAVNLRHLITGLYLTAKPYKEPNLGSPPLKSSQSAQAVPVQAKKCYFVLKPEPSEESEFIIKGIELNEGEEEESGVVFEKKQAMKIDSYIRFQNKMTGFWLSLEKINTQSIQMTKISSGESMVPVGLRRPLFEDMFKLQKAKFARKWELYFLVGTLPVVKYATMLFRNWSLDSIKLRAVKFIENSLKKVLLFSYESSGSTSLSPTPFGLSPSENRQTMLVEQKMVANISLLLSNIFPNEKFLKFVNSESEEDLEMSEKNLLAKKKIRESRETVVSIAKICYEILTSMIHQNERSQNEAFDFIHIYINHIGHKINALQCLCSIIGQNERLQNLMRESKRNSPSPFSSLIKNMEKFEQKNIFKNEYLDALKTLCLVDEIGLTPNQLIVLKAIYSGEIQGPLFTKIISSPSKKSMCLEIEGKQILLEDVFSPGSPHSSNTGLHDEIFHQIQLFASLCQGRNYKARSYVTKECPFEAAQSYIWNISLPVDLRAAFVNLIIHAHIDSKPMSKQNFKKMLTAADANILKTIGEATGAKKSPNRMLSLLKQKSTKKKEKNALQQYRPPELIQLEENGSEILEDIGEKVDELKIELMNQEILSYLVAFTRNSQSFDPFLCKLLHLTRVLIYFGHFSSQQTYEGPVNLKQFNLPSNRMDFLVRKVFLEIIQKKKTVSKRKSILFQRSNSMANLNNFDSMGGLSQTFDSDSLLSQNEILSKNEILRLLKHLSQANINNKLKLDAQMSETLSKKEILKSFLFMFKEIKFRELQKFVAAFQLFSASTLKNQNIKKEKLEEYVRQKFINKGEFLPQIGGSKSQSINSNELFAMSLKIFLKCMDFELKYLSLKLIFASFKLRMDFLKNAKKYLLIFTESEKQILSFMQSKVLTFSRLVEESESWFLMEAEENTPLEQPSSSIVGRQSTRFQEEKDKKLQTIISILDTMTYLMYEDVTFSQDKKDIDLSKFKATSKVSYIRQKMLKNLRAPDLIVKLLRDGMHILEKIKESNEDQNHHLIQIFKGCYSFLCVFVRQNRKLSKKLIEASLSLLIVQLSYFDVGQSELFTSLFKNDCTRNKEKIATLIAHFTGNIKEKGRKSTYLNFLKMTLMEFETPIVSTQRQLLTILFNEEFIKHFLYVKKEKGPNNEDTFRLDLEFLEKSADNPYIYHYQLFKILSICIENDDPNSNLLKSMIVLYYPLEGLLDNLLQDDLYSVHLPDFQENDRIFLQSLLKPSIIQLIQKLYIPHFPQIVFESLAKVQKWIEKETKKLKTLTEEDQRILAAGEIHKILSTEQLGVHLAAYNQHLRFNYPKHLVRYFFPFLLEISMKLPDLLEDYDFITNYVSAFKERFFVISDYLHEHPVETKILCDFVSFFEISKEEVGNLTEEGEIPDQKEEESQKSLEIYSFIRGFGTPDEQLVRQETIRSSSINMKRILWEMEIPFKSFLMFENDDGNPKTTMEQTLWKMTVLNMLVSPEMVLEVERERKMMLDMFFSLKDDDEISMPAFLNSIMSFISLAINQPRMHQLCSNSLNLLNDILGRFERTDDKQFIQDLFNANGVTNMVLTLLNDESLPFAIYSEFAKLLIGLLEGGNRKVQETIFNFFSNHSESETFFAIINREIQNFFKNPQEKLTSRLCDYLGHIPLAYHFDSIELDGILRLLQLFCEGHYSNMQNYIRNQFKSRVSFNMIFIVVRLMGNINENLTAQNYKMLIQCFDSIIEFIQGPCPENQMSLIETKFLEICSSLLSRDDEVMVQTNQKTSNDSAVLTKTVIRGFEKISMNFAQKVSQSLKKSSQTDIEKPMMARIKYKVLVALEALFEGQKKNPIMVRCMTREIPPSDLRKNLVSVYERFQKVYNSRYTMENFQKNIRSLGKPEDQDKESVIIETGFKLFHMLRTFADIQLNDLQDQDVKAVLASIRKEYQEAISYEISFSKFFKTTLISSVDNAVIISFNGKKKLTKLRRLRHQRINGNLDEKTLKQMVAHDALIFFDILTSEIDVVREGVVEKIYFPILPYCLFLSSTHQSTFHQKVNRFSLQTKHSDLLDAVETTLLKLKREEALRLKYGRSIFIEMFTKHHRAWKDISYYIMLFINILFCLSFARNMNYSEGQSHSEEDEKPNYGIWDIFSHIHTSKFTYELEISGKFYNVTEFIVLLILIHFVTSTLSFLVYLVKHAPVIYQMAHAREEKSKGTTESKLRKLILYSAAYIREKMFIRNAYYSFFSFLSMMVWPVFIVFLLIEIVNRSPLLGYIIQSIWRPKKQIMLTILMVIISIYFFSIVSLIFASGFFRGGCDNLFNCFWLCFDRIFKYDGGIGGYLLNINTEMELLSWSMVLYTFSYNLIVLILLFEMMAGVIIDTFGELRSEEDKKLADMRNVCFVCGKDKDTIDKDVKSKGFLSHVRQEHNMWNYLFYVAYLTDKDKTELSGIESYVWEKIKAKDTAWFPIMEFLEENDNEKKMVKTYQEYISLSMKYLKDVSDKADAIKVNVEGIETQTSILIKDMESKT